LPAAVEAVLTALNILVEVEPEDIELLQELLVETLLQKLL
jgi:hypothetical protein